MTTSTTGSFLCTIMRMSASPPPCSALPPSHLLFVPNLLSFLAHPLHHYRSILLRVEPRQRRLSHTRLEVIERKWRVRFDESGRGEERSGGNGGSEGCCRRSREEQGRIPPFAEDGTIKIRGIGNGGVDLLGERLRARFGACGRVEIQETHLASFASD